MRTVRQVLVAVLAVAMVMVASPASANHSWGRYHWGRSANPFDVPVVDSLSSAAWGSILGLVANDPTANDWTDSAVLDTPVSAGTASSSCSPILGNVRVCNDAYGSNGWLGIAQIWIYTGSSHIAQGTVKVNDYYFNTSAYNDSNAKRHVMCQEVGHTLGLDHQHLSDVGGGVTCMNDTAGLKDPAYVAPNQHDYDQLAKIYCHLDGGASCPGGGGKKNPGHSNSSSEFHSSQGRYEVITFVRWAD